MTSSRSPLSRNSRSPLQERKRILVVDDKASDTKLVKICLEQTNAYVVREENNARAALAMAPRVAELMARELKRDKAWQAREIEAFAAIAEGYLVRAS